MIELYKDGDAMAIRTDAKIEEDFHSQFTELLARMIDQNAHLGDWEFQLGFWLPQYVEICCAYRGYKADVDVQKVYIAGDRMFKGEPEHLYRDRSHYKVTVIQPDNDGIPWVSAVGPSA